MLVAPLIESKETCAVIDPCTPFERLRDFQQPHGLNLGRYDCVTVLLELARIWGRPADNADIGRDVGSVTVVSDDIRSFRLVGLASRKVTGSGGPYQR